MPTQDELNKMADETALLWIDETTGARHMSKEAQKKAGYTAPKNANSKVVVQMILSKKAICA